MNKPAIAKDHLTIIHSGSLTPPKVPLSAPPTSAASIIDATTFQTLEIEKLFEALNHTNTQIGAAILYRSLQTPLGTEAAVTDKQDALRELESDEELCRSLEDLVHQTANLESDYYRLLFGTFLGLIGSPAHELEFEGFGYEIYSRGTRFMLNLVALADALPPTKSRYLQDLINNIRMLAGSRAYTLMKGPAYRTEKSIVTKAERKWYEPALKFRPSLFKPVGLTATLIALALVFQFVPLLLEMAASIAPVFWLFLLPLGFLYIPIVGNFDRDGFIYPLRQIFKQSPEMQLALDALGQIDELLAFWRYKSTFGHPVNLPKIAASTHHQSRLQGVRNPILAKGNPAYVGNDAELADERLTFITGPNSGGKTAYCKTLAQSQVMAQIGCYVPAENAVMSIADRIHYQVPEISHLSDGEGRFGTELKRTKEVFLNSSARSLVIMDELSEGTTHEEKIEISTDILEGFRKKGATTILITHNHELVEHFRAKGIGIARQAEFMNESPTYRLIDGISKVSHADRVAKKIGFAKEDIARLLGEG